MTESAVSPEGEQGNEFEVPPRELVEALERAVIDPVVKHELLLIQMGLKPATDIDIDTEDTDPSVLRRYLDRSGLRYADAVDARKDKVIAVGRSLEDLQRMLTALQKNEHTAYGRAYGIPETAIQGFVANNRLTKEEFDMLFPDPELQFYTHFVPSADNWTQEMHVMTRNLAAMKRVSPVILEQLYNQEGGDPDWARS